MKRLTLTSLFLLMVAIMIAQPARIQVIHNSPDPAADTVNVYAGNTPLLTDFAFREATPFIDAAPGNVRISVLPKGETDTSNAVFQTNLTLNSGNTYVAVATGIVDTASFNAKEPFSIEVFANGQEMGTMGSTDVLVKHGSPDAPPVDVVETGQGAGTLINNLVYPNFTPAYAPLPTQDYRIQLLDSSQNVTVREYDAPLQTLGLADSALVLLASGFVNTIENPGPAFTLIAVLPNGNVIELPATSTKAQIIHNSGDPAASTVDVWLNTQKILSDFAYRTATPFVDIPANSDITVSVTASGSIDTSNALIQQQFNLPADSAFVVVASGVSNDPMFDSIKPLRLDAAPGLTAASSSGNTDVLLYHGATDAGPVNVEEVTVPATLATNFGFGQFEGYVSLATSDYEVEIQDPSTSATLARYGAPLQTLGLADSSVVVLASGFIDTAKGSTTLPAFGLWAALPSGGTLVPLPVLSGLSTEEQKSLARLSVYPNPAAESLTLETDRFAAGTAETEVLDMSGARIMQQALQVNPGEDQELNVSSLKSGSYILRVRDSEGQVFTRQLQIR